MHHPTCPECGAPVSPGGAVCPQCGFPLRRDQPLGGGGARRGSSTANKTGLIIALVVGFFGVFVIGGILAALAIPRFARATSQAKEIEGVQLMKQAFTAEQSYYAAHGAYTEDLSQLPGAGPHHTSRYYYGVTVYTQEPLKLCIEAVSRRPDVVPTLSMDTVGAISNGPCPEFALPDAHDSSAR